MHQMHSLLGVGGMGEVYRARDTKLERDVAIKTLPLDVADDPERLARFEREARVLASLNDPHIGATYGFEDATTSVPSSRRQRSTSSCSVKSPCARMQSHLQFRLPTRRARDNIVAFTPVL